MHANIVHYLVSLLPPSVTRSPVGSVNKMHSHSGTLDKRNDIVKDAQFTQS